MIPAVEFRNVSKSYGRRVIVRSLNFSVEANSFTVLFGAPACGKSTVMRLLAGLEKPDAGTILLRDKDVTREAPGKRNIGYVPQSFALYPHYTVFENIAYPLTLLGYARAEVKPVVENAAEQLKISHLLQKKPDQCSGGEKQRIAIARGMVKNTDIFVLDDPLTGLDFKLRERLFDDLGQMKDALKATFIYTTSDALEALILAERIGVLDGGSMVEIGELEKVYDNPEHVRVMELLGFPEANILDGELNGQHCKTPLFEFPVSLIQSSDVPSQIKIGLRPQDILLNPPPASGLMTCAAEITLVEDLGSELVVYLDAAGLALRAVSRHSDQETVTEGQVQIGVDPHRLYLYADASGYNIGRGMN